MNRIHISGFKFILLVGFFSICLSTSVEAQSRANNKYSENDDDYEEEMTLRERIYLGTYVNTPSFSGDNFGATFGVTGAFATGSTVSVFVFVSSFDI